MYQHLPSRRALRRLRRPPGDGTGYRWGSSCGQSAEGTCQENQLIREPQAWDLPPAGINGPRCPHPLLPLPDSFLRSLPLFSSLHSTSGLAVSPSSHCALSKLKARPFHVPVRTCEACTTLQTPERPSRQPGPLFFPPPEHTPSPPSSEPLAFSPLR